MITNASVKFIQIRVFNCWQRNDRENLSNLSQQTTRIITTATISNIEHENHSKKRYSLHRSMFRSSEDLLKYILTLR